MFGFQERLNNQIYINKYIANLENNHDCKNEKNISEKATETKPKEK